MATKAEIMAEDRHRISTILESPEGLRNPAMARRLAIERGMDARDAIELLKSAPAANPYLAAMDAQGAIGIGAPATASGLSDPRDLKRAEIAASMAIFNSVQGHGRRPRN
jgi:hypothetical protein